MTELFSFSFKIPFQIDVNNRLEQNHNAELIKERYHLKVAIGNQVEWYIITKTKDVTDKSGDSKEVTALYLPQELNDKIISGYSEDSLNARQVLNDILSLSATWNIEYLDADFELTYRSFEFNNNSLLEAIYIVAETYNAIVEWNTDARTFRLIKPELQGINRLGTISHKRYLKSLNREYDAEKVITRLIAKGKDNLGIQRVNPTGQAYIEDFTYWMFPFQRDENKNVLEHSLYMSDDLCNALLDYQELVEQNKENFASLTEQMDELMAQLSTKNAELVDLENELKVINEIRNVQQIGVDVMMFLERFNFNGTTASYTYQLKNNFNYAVLIKVDDVTGKTFTIDGQPSYMMSGTWVVSKKLAINGTVGGSTNLNITFSGTGSTGVFIQIANISQVEYNTSGNEDLIVEKYSFDNKEMQISAKRAEITQLQNLISGVNNQINGIRNLLSVENNFTQTEWEELDGYILYAEFSDEKFIEDKDLYEAAQKRFEELKTPELSLDIDIVNFLEILEEQRVWNQLFLGDKVIIKYERFDLKIEAKIIEMKFDYEKGSIKLTIANFKDLSTGRQRFEKYIANIKNKVTSIGLDSSKWTQAVVDSSEFSQIFENFWDKTTNQINMAVNQCVTIDDKGITITEKNDPLRFMRLTNGALGLTRSGGVRYETAITADGLIAEMVLGKLILGQRVTIGDNDGIWMTEGPKTTITDRFGRVAMKLGLYEENPDLYGIIVNRYASDDPNARIINKIIMNSDVGFQIQQWNGIEYKDKFYVDTEGLLYAEDMTTKRLKIVSDTDELLLDSYTKYMDIGKFENIITDGKLTALEKLQVLGERDRIQSEYQKLLAQAQAYATTSRDDTIRIDTTNFTNAYNALMTYLTPLLANMDETTTIDRNEFINKFKTYYDEVVNIINAINDSIKYSSVQLGTFYNNVVIDAMMGIVVTRSDELYRTILNATDGISIEKKENGSWVKKFYVNVTDSRLWVEELVAKKLTIVNDFEDILLDARTDYLNIGRFETIIADGKLTAIEKLTLKQEWETIQTEYNKLLSQANQYKTSIRDNYTTILIDIPPFVNAFNDLYSYVTPLLADMSATSTVDRDEFKSKFQAYYDQAQRIINEITDALKWSSLQLGQEYNKVVIDAINGIVVSRSDGVVQTIMNATSGIQITRNGQPVFFADTMGTLHAIDLVAKRLKITTDPFGGDTEDTLLLDADSRTLWLNRWDIIGAAAIVSDMIAANFVTAEYGMISNLTAGRLSTLTNAAVSDWSNYITIQENSAKWITGKVSGSGTQLTLTDGRPLYWANSSQTGLMTTEVTSWPVMKYPMDEKVKMELVFEGLGDAAYPSIYMGLGDFITPLSGKAVLSKPADGLELKSFARSTGLERSILYRDEGITVYTDNGIIRLEHNSGTKFEITQNGNDITLAHKTAGTLTLNTTNGFVLNIVGNVNLTATGSVNFSGTSYNFS